jgi:DNA-binding NarL/FixJ family response regulator
VSRIRIFVADDHPDVLEKVASLLGHAFDIVGTATDGQSAYEGVRRLMPDVLVIDITMPVVSGIETVAKLKETGHAPKVVFLTVHSDPDFLRAGLATGAFGYVLKARVATDLVPSVQHALEGRIYISPFPEYKK